MKDPDPMFAGQQITHKCPKDGKKHIWQARYNQGFLQFWCIHGKMKRAKEIIERYPRI